MKKSTPVKMKLYLKQTLLQTSKKAFTWSYFVSLLASAVAVFRHAHLYQLGPGFTLMVFAMKFFVLFFLASWVCLFFIFFVFKKISIP